MIASADAPPPPAGATVVRFAGVPTSGEQVPADLERLRDEAADTIKRTYPDWLAGWAKRSGVLDLAVWEGRLSWWWYGALSERSPQLTPLIHQLHQLVLLRLVLRRWRAARIVWYDGSAEMLRAAARVAAAEEARLEPVRIGRAPRGERFGVAVLHRVYAVFRELARAAGMRLLRFGGPPAGGAAALGFTRFPVLWECADGAWRERMFGRLPDALARHGIEVAYAAIATGSPVLWLRNWMRWRRVLADRCIHVLNSYATLADLLAALFPVRLWARYWRWRRRQAWQVAFDGIEVGALLRSATDAALLDPNLAVNRLVARTLPRLLRRETGVRYLLHPFEFQPMERAAAVGARQAGAIKVVGLQTGLFTSGQMGFLLRREELRRGPMDEADPGLAPVPDLIAAYGRLAFRCFAQGVGPGRAIEVGATRYGGLGEFAARPYRIEDERRALGLPAGVRHVLVATTSVREEAWPMLAGARALAAARADVFLSFKFHYHLPLDAEVAAAMRGVADGRWKIFGVRLHELLRAVDVLVTGASSVAYEALALGKRPLVYLSPAAFHCNPATETPAAFRFWHAPAQLAALLDEAQGEATAAAGALADQMALVADGESRLVDAIGRLPSCACGGRR